MYDSYVNNNTEFLFGKIVEHILPLILHVKVSLEGRVMSDADVIHPH